MDTKSTEKRLYDIVAGPSKAMLFDACKYAYAKTAKLPVDFTIAIRYTLPTKHNPKALSFRWQLPTSRFVASSTKMALEKVSTCMAIAKPTQAPLQKQAQLTKPTGSKPITTQKAARAISASSTSSTNLFPPPKPTLGHFLTLSLIPIDYLLTLNLY